MKESEAKGKFLLLMILSAYFFYLGSRSTVDEYICFPEHRSQLSYVVGSLAYISRSTRFGDSITIVDANGELHEYGVARQLADQLSVYVGQKIKVGEVSGAFCSPLLNHVESEERVVLDFDQVVLNRARGKWILRLMSAMFIISSIGFCWGGFSIMAKSKKKGGNRRG